MSNLKTLEELIDEMTNKGLARSGITIGKRAQEYGREEKIRSARIQFSFSVDSNRLADVSFSAKSNPDKNSFIQSRTGIWWWSDPGREGKRTYANNIEYKIESAIKKGLVQYDEKTHTNTQLLSA